MLLPNKTITVTNAGGGETLVAYQIPDIIYIEPDSGSVILAAPYRLDYATLPPSGSKFSVIIASGIDLNSQGLTIFGNSYTATMQNSGKDWSFNFTVVDSGGGTLICEKLPIDLADTGCISGAALVDETVTLAKLEDLVSGKIILGDGTNRPAAVTPTGDVTISNAGVTAIGAGVIVNADVNAAAAIDRSKLASGTADHVVINSGAGAFSSEAQLAESRGGTGLDTSVSTGFATVSAGTWSVGSISEVITLLVSFEAAGGTTPSVGDFKIKMPYAGTVTEIYAYAVKAIAGTDNGTIVPKNNGGTTMTSGTITFTASDARGTAYTSTPSANNTFAAGDLLTFTTAKTTAGGLVQLSITVTRTS